MTNKELIYVTAIGVIGVYAILLTVMLLVMNKKVKKSHNLLEEKIQKNSQSIEDSDKKIDKSIAEVDDKLQREREANQKQIGELFDNAITATSMLVDEKTKNITDKMEDISLRLNIMDSTVKNLEREKAFVQTLLTDGDEPVEAHYYDVPKDSFLNNARKAVKNAAKSGGDFVKNCYPVIKDNLPDIAKAIKKIKK